MFRLLAGRDDFATFVKPIISGLSLCSARAHCGDNSIYLQAKLTTVLKSHRLPNKSIINMMVFKYFAMYLTAFNFDSCKPTIGTTIGNDTI